MRIFAGPLRTGFTAILTALLLPVLGFGVAVADMNVGDTVMLKVPDLAEFPDPIEEHQFTCRAVTEHAYWLVQDSVSVREGTGPGVEDTTVWGNIFTQDELDVLTADFEGNGSDVNVYGTVTEYFGAVPDTDGDPRLWIVLATMRDQYTYQNNPIDRKTMEYVNPADLSDEEEFNDQDIIYINVHTFTDNASVLNSIAKELRRYYIPNGLGRFVRTALNAEENLWLSRGIGEVAQYLCYGMTATETGGFGIQFDVTQFGNSAFFELMYWNAGTPNMDFAGTRGQAFLWLMYLAQRQGDAILETIARSDSTGMMNIAMAIDPSVPEDEAIQTNVVPIYKDWLVCNLTSNLQDDMAGGIYRYDIFSDPEGYQFSHTNHFSAFEAHFDTGDYPLDVWLPGDGVVAPIWSAQYNEFEGDYPSYPTFYFNGEYADAGGSASAIDGKWILMTVSIDTASEEIVAVEEAELSELYNGSFDLEGDMAFTIVTNNNEGGAAGLRYVLSQDTEVADVLMAVHQNSVNDQYLKVYSSMMGEDPEGFDWYGPIFTASTADSTSMIGMSEFYETIWNASFNAWEAGNFNLQVAGYDSSGFYASAEKDVAVGYATAGKLTLTVESVSLEVQPGAVAPGTMVSLCQSGILDMAVQSQARVDDLTEMMTGVLAGPVSIPDVSGTLSFPAESSDGAVYRYTAEGWEKLNSSFYQGGRMCATVSDGGIYAYGEAPGVSSPQIPAEFGFGGIHPNPFSAQAAIRFSLPSSGRVNVTIYDMSGRAVRTLADTEMGASEHTLVWNGLDESGNAVGAGVYFCRLQAAGETITQKMLRIE
ncbi:MAG: FlgD immunoglobulin-like domain containing protein [Candidatus Aegiribacteria sp.]